ncbi:hypothetical protein SAMN04489761_4244 [Tenacibaculum sp. MAR_2009_124]|uniref:hypothetical protein n=1 Tax=Tenacibaculum sp. MAR_2009_124 TaxID=1250059 RepID=UPI00089C2F25|nr:hypothetical protein [Tenacibaculum sp. MAR_2009_124]SED09129.1 hypothetical protein SAMN04489761_4244 [Tenacibaculum sp. MAR_2009_124]
MNNKSDGEILNEVMQELGITNASHFARELGYANGSAISNILRGESGKYISEKLITKITNRYPLVEEFYLRKGEGSVLKEKVSLESHSINDSNYTLNDLPTLIAELIKEQKRTNELLSEFVNKN